MNLLKKLLLLSIFHLFIYCNSNGYAQILTLNDSSSQIQLSAFSSVFITLNDSLLPFDLDSINWKKSKTGMNFGLSKGIYWVKCNINNITNKNIHLNSYTPYHQIRNIKIYQKNKFSTKLIADFGTTKYYSNKEIETPGYSKKIVLPPGKSTLFYRFKHLHIPLKANTFLLSDDLTKKTISKTNSFIKIWKIIVIFAIMFSLIVYLLTKFKLFLYYGILNIGVILFIGTDIGMFFHFFDIDSNQIIMSIIGFGNIVVVSIFPFFINELTTIKSIKPRLWKLLLIMLCISPILWLLDVCFPFYRDTKLFYYALIFVINSAAIVFLIQIYLLFIASKRRLKNARLLLFIYLIYVTAVIIEITLPNLGYYSNSLYAYDMLLKSSIVEIFLFLILIGKEMNSVNKDRNKLILKQQVLQQDMLKAVVTSQEKERNTLGRELHDMIGANMSVVKQNIDKSNSGLVKIMDDTIDSVRSLSHGLMTPKVEGDQLKDEIIDLCLLSSNDSFKVNYYFHDWEPLINKENSTHLYRIIQELLQNTLKHSGADEAYLQVIRNKNKVTLLFEDNGIGFNTEKERKRGKGLLGIEHRTEILKGNLRYDSSSKGTSVELNFKD